MIIIEMKINLDKQHVLMIPGFFLFSRNDLKIALVSFYDYTEKTIEERKKVFSKPKEVVEIIERLEKKYRGRFKYFHIENGWSKQLNELAEFCSL